MWANSGLISQEFYYFPVGEYNANDYKFDKTEIFKSDVVNIAAEIDRELREDEGAA